MAELYKVSGKKLPAPATRGEPERVELRPGGWIVLTRADGTRVRGLLAEGGGRLAALWNGRSFAGDLVEEARGGTAGGSGADDFVAQFPGKVRKLLVKAGETVIEGQSLVFLEAMKMEFPVRAPAAGRVTKVLVTEGQQLAPGDRLLEFEPASAAEAP